MTSLFEDMNVHGISCVVHETKSIFPETNDKDSFDLTSFFENFVVIDKIAKIITLSSLLPNEMYPDDSH